MSSLVFDSSSLIHFARADVLEELRTLVADRTCVITEEVAAELAQGATRHPAVTSVPALSWLSIRELTSTEHLQAFARYKGELGGGPERNLGEASVLAWASVSGATAIVDERAAMRIANRDKIEAHGTLWLVANGLRAGVLERARAEEIIDLLIASGMRLPVDGAGFVTWAEDHGLIP